jgi:hypothetical protein
MVFVRSPRHLDADPTPKPIEVLYPLLQGHLARVQVVLGVVMVSSKTERDHHRQPRSR